MRGSGLREAVILASGLGTRLREITGGTPKCFYEIGGLPLVLYPAHALRLNGVTRVTAVVPPGMKSRALQTLGNLFNEVCVVENNEVESGNAYSLKRAEECVKSEYFLVTVCDSLYPPSTVERIIRYREGVEADVVVGGSRVTDYVDVDEATKILAIDGEVYRIGKELTDYTHIDIGLFVMKDTVFQVASKMRWGREVSLFELIEFGIREGLRVVVADLGDTPWTEVDTLEDLRELLWGRRKAVLDTILRELSVG